MGNLIRNVVAKVEDEVTVATRVKLLVKWVGGRMKQNQCLTQCLIFQSVCQAYIIIPQPNLSQLSSINTECPKKRGD